MRNRNRNGLHLNLKEKSLEELKEMAKEVLGDSTEALEYIEACDVYELRFIVKEKRIPGYTDGVECLPKN